MIQVVLYSDDNQNEAIEVGYLPPSEIVALVDLIRTNGTCIGDKGLAYVSSAYDMEKKRYEIVVAEEW